MNVLAKVAPNILHAVHFDHEGKPHCSLPPGTIAFTINGMKTESLMLEPGTVVGLLYVCPCGCGGIGGLPFYKYDNHDAWDWNGSKEKPTLTPSILRKQTCGWHGFLTDGVFNW